MLGAHGCQWDDGRDLTNKHDPGEGCDRHRNVPALRRDALWPAPWDLEVSREGPLAAAENIREFLGHVGERIADKFRFTATPLESLAFVVEAFGTCWARLVEGSGVGRAGWGRNAPLDVSAFIERTIRTIHTIANRHEPEAVGALQHLIANHAPSYVDTARQAQAFQRKCQLDLEHEIQLSTASGRS